MACSHWFDGFTTVHKFDMVPAEDRVTEISYSSYCQVDELLEKARSTGHLEGFSFGQKRDPCDSFFRKFKTMFSEATPGGAPHTANIGVAFRETQPHERERAQKDGADVSGRRLMTVTTDAHQTKHFDADTLEPVGVTAQSVLHPSLTGPLSGAHAAHDPETGDIFNYNLAFGAKPTYRIFRASPSTGKVDVLATVSGKDIRGAYLHSIMLSQNFVIVCIWPAYFQMAGASILWNRNLLESIQSFDPKAKTTWLVIDRRHGSGLVKKFTTPGFFCFHTVNAWEEHRAGAGASVDIVCELVQHDNMDILHQFYYENLVSNERGVKAFNSTRRANMSGGLARYKLTDVAVEASVSSPKLSLSKAFPAERISLIPFPDSGDLPRINPRYALKPHRYVWGVIDRQRSSFVDAIGKTDIATGQCLLWECDRHTPSEPIFVPDPEADGEDDGVVLTVVLDGPRGTSYLLCLDARTMKEIGRADARTPVGMGFHGAHIRAPSSETRV